MNAGPTPNTISQRLSRFAVTTLAAAGLAACATTNSGMPPPASGEPDKLVADAQVTLNNFLRDPDQTWVQENLGRAKAVLIVPQTREGRLHLRRLGRPRRARRARMARTWVGPAFYDLATASVGFQAGVEVSEAVIVVMTEKGLNSLMSSSFKIGGDASVAAGPVGAGAKSTITADLVIVHARQGRLRRRQSRRHRGVLEQPLERRLLRRQQRTAAGHPDSQDGA